MNLKTTDELFAWDRLEDSPDLATVRAFFAQLPDARLLDALATARGRGRNDYPVRVLLYCAMLQPLLRHTTMRATLDELRRNLDLRRLGGMASPGDVPKAHNMSRFLAVLGQEPFWGMLQAIFATQAGQLGEVVPDLGRLCAGDSTHLSARRARRTGADREAPAPDGGRKEYTDKDGVVVRVVEWFGYKLHLICDARHEVALAYDVTPASRPDNETLETLIEEAASRLPPGRIRSLAYDKAADDGAIHEALDKLGIRPVIQNRSLWKGEHERVVSGAGIGNVVHDEAGTIYCYDMVSPEPVRHRMAYIGHEPKRGTLKYRCPAAHEGWTCPCATRCNAGKCYGMTVRVKREMDLRRFPPIPRATKTFERLYKGRSAVERVNGRLKVFWGADDGNLAGGANFHAKVGLVMLVHIGLATLLARAPRRAPGQRLGQTRLSTVTRVLSG